MIGGANGRTGIAAPAQRYCLRWRHFRMLDALRDWLLLISNILAVTAKGERTSSMQVYREHGNYDEKPELQSHTHSALSKYIVSTSSFKSLRSSRCICLSP